MVVGLWGEGFWAQGKQREVEGLGLGLYFAGFRGLGLRV